MIRYISRKACINSVHRIRRRKWLPTFPLNNAINLFTAVRQHSSLCCLSDNTPRERIRLSSVLSLLHRTDTGKRYATTVQTEPCRQGAHLRAMSSSSQANQDPGRDPLTAVTSEPFTHWRNGQCPQGCSVVSRSRSSAQSSTIFSQVDSFPTNYNWNQSTEWNYQCNSSECYGPFQASRLRLDYTFHKNYVRHRQKLQDDILYSLLRRSKEREVHHQSPATPPWLVFTAGAMGVGKNYVMDQLGAQGHFPLQCFAEIDPDNISVQLPEVVEYCRRNPDTAYTYIHKESGYIAELAMLEFLDRRKNIIIHGSLRNHCWYTYFLQNVLQVQYKCYRVGIIHVVAPKLLIERRASERGKQGICGRRVPKEYLVESYNQVPASVKALRPHVHFTAEIENGVSDLRLIQPASWKEFKAAFCSFDQATNELHGGGKKN